MKMTKAMFTAAALAAAAAFAGDSAPFLLDTAEGTRIAHETEPIAYSPRWGDAAECSVTVATSATLPGGEGRDALVASATDEGTFSWTRPATPGCYTLTHTAGAEVYTAQFAVLGDDVVPFGGVLAAGETWTTDKVWLITAPLTIPSGVSLTIEPGAVVKFMPGASLTVANGGSCIARGAIFTHVADDTIGGDTLMDGAPAVAIPVGEYRVTGITEDDSTEYRYYPPQTLEADIGSDTRLRVRTYVVSNSVTVASGATLTLQPGTILKFNTGCSLTVNGTLDAQGTRAAPIVFTSLKDDAHGGDTNGDGDKTYAQAGDWARIYAGGTLTMKFCRIRYCNNNSDQGAIQGTGGTVTFDNSIIESSVYECVRMNSGRFTAHNSIFRDSSMGFGYYGGSGVYVYNCVVADCTTGCRASNKHFYNTVFYRCHDAFLESTSSSCDHCVFYNPPGYGPQSATQVGSSGNIWGDPLFVDAENGDFRVAANSPCVDAGDGSVAPELDYYGQPRMDVKGVKDTGKPDAGGVCPDIGIYEVPGSAAVPLPDLAVLRVAGNGDGLFAPGDSLTVTYTVTNRGAAAASGAVRDLFRFKGADASLGGITIDAAEIEQAYNLAAGTSATMTATFTVPTLKAGAWKVCVEVNPSRDIYEQNLSNNRATAEETVRVELEAMGMGSQSVTVGKGGTAGFVLSALPAAGGVVRIEGAGAAQIAAYGGNGAVPTVATSATLPTVSLPDGSLLVVFPARAAGENAYLVLENGGNAEATVSVEVKETELKLYGAEPGRIANAGEATVTVTGSGLNADAAVTLGGRAAKRVETLNAAQIAATFDVEGMAAGTYEIAAVSGGAQDRLTDAVEIYAAKTGPKLRAWLEMPSSVRDGRVFTGYVCYANEGDSPMTMPVFKVAREDSSTKMGLAASESLAETKLYVGGISPTHPAGVLKAGDEGRIPFYFQPFGTYRVKLSHVRDAEDLEAYPAFGGTKAYLAAMGAAATRLNLRGRTAYNIHDFVDQALWEKNGVAHAAVSGYLVDAKTGEALANTGISLVDAGRVALVATDSDAQERVPPATGTTDEHGYFQLTNLADGEYRWLMDEGVTLADSSTNTLTIADQADLNGVSVQATPGGRISGYVLTADGEPVGYGTVALLDVGGSVSAAVEADGYGAFAFSGLSDGTYGVRSMPKDGYAMATVTNLVIDAVTRSVEAEIEVERGAVLGGVVTYNGALVTNGTVQAVKSDGVSVQTLCGTNGVYRFDGIAPDSYAVRYYSNVLESEDVWVSLNAGDAVNLDISTVLRPLFEPTHSKDYGSCTTAFVFTDPARAEGVTAWAWDFDSDDVVDSTEAEPTWTYSSLGTNTVTLTITEATGTTTSIYRNCVIVEKKLDTILASGAIVFGENSGTLVTEAVTDTTLTLSGNPASGSIEEGNVILGKMGEEWYCRRVTGASKSGGKWQLTTIGATWDEAYEQCTLATTGKAFVDQEPSAASAPKRLMTRALKRDEGGSETKFRLFAEGGVEVTTSLNKTLDFEYEREKVDGKVKERYALVGHLDFANEIAIQGTVGMRLTHEYTLPIKLVSPTPVPGVTFESGIKAYIEGDAHIKGSASIGCELNTILRLGFEMEKGQNPHFLKPFDVTPDGHMHGDLEGSVSVKVGLKPEFKAKFAGVMSAVLAVDAYGKAEVTATAKAPVEAGVSIGLDFIGELNLVDIDVGIFSRKLGYTKTIQGPHRDIIKWYSPNPDFEYSPSKNLEAPATVQFTDKSEGAHWQILNAKIISEITGYEWNLGNGLCSNLKNPSTTYSEKGTYTVSLKAKGDGINGPYRKKKKIRVGEREDDDPPGNDGGGGDGWEGDGGGGGTSKKSSDPNEVTGPAGVGEEKLVKPGDWLDYTVYFENQTNATADAQEVVVETVLSPQLDWSTFELLHVAFGDRVDAGLEGCPSGTSSVDFGDAGRKVRTTAAFNPENGGALWIIRIWDDEGMFGWPNDGSGFLPPNDKATHCGEGYVTYRVKVREDAEPGAKIVSSATIVFDYNDSITTDPCWTNTVAQMANVTIAGGGGDAEARRLIVGQPVGELPDPGARDGYTFGGWYTRPEGQGMRVTAATLVTADMTGIYAYWIKDAEPEPEPQPEPQKRVSLPWTAKKAVTLDGAVYDADGKVAGVVQLKVAKPNAKKHNAKVSGSVTLLDGKKRTLKAAAVNVPADAPITANLAIKGLGTLLLAIGDDGFEGSVGGYSVAAAKVGGAWTRKDARVTVATSASLPEGTVKALLPGEDGVPVRVKGGKWAFDKAASITYKKGALGGDNDPKKPNRSAMKLSYTPKTGLFKGSFKVYAIQSGKLKKYTVKVTGVVVDGEGTGVGKLAKPATAWSVGVK